MNMTYLIDVDYYTKTYSCITKDNKQPWKSQKSDTKLDTEINNTLSY